MAFEGYSGRDRAGPGGAARRPPGGLLESFRPPGRSLRGRRTAARPDVRLAALHHEAGLLAHDLNNLLNVSLAANEALTETLAIGSDAHEMAQVGLDATERSAELVRRLLALSEPRREAEPRCDAAAAMRCAARLARLSAPPTVLIHCDVAEARLACRADRSGLESALLNLCLNAGHAMPEGGVVELSARAVGAEIVLTCRDTGCGMSPEVLAQAAEPYFTTRRGRGGTGLGLAGVRALARRSGGRLDLESEPGRGTRVTLTLPNA